MSEKDTSEPAFPVHPNVNLDLDKRWCDMTLREYFAAKAMQGICANEQTAGKTFDEVSLRAWKMADAMLVARKG